MLMTARNAADGVRFAIEFLPRRKNISPRSVDARFQSNFGRNT
jgi:hypothetical protein